MLLQLEAGVVSSRCSFQGFSRLFPASGLFPARFFPVRVFFPAESFLDVHVCISY